MRKRPRARVRPARSTTAAEMGAPLIDFDYAVVRVVPHVHLGAFVNVGLVLHARQARFLRVRFAEAEAVGRAVQIEPARLARFFDAYRRVGEADDAGALGLLPPSERFHWLTAPRSAVLQASPVHTGRASDLAAAFDRLFELHVPPFPV